MEGVAGKVTFALEPDRVGEILKNVLKGFFPFLFQIPMKAWMLSKAYSYKVVFLI